MYITSHSDSNNNHLIYLYESWCIFSGFLSDVCPIYGLRRKPYLTIGALVYSAAFLLYAILGMDNLVGECEMQW